MKHDISVLDALRSLIDYAAAENLPAAHSALMSMLVDTSHRFDDMPRRVPCQIVPFKPRKKAG